MSSNTGKGVSGNVLVVTVAVIVVVSVAAGGWVTVAAPDQAGTFLTVLFANLASTVAVMVNLVKTHNVEHQVDNLANGLMDAKIRSNVAEVIDPALIDDQAIPQLEEDHARIAEHRRAEKG